MGEASSFRLVLAGHAVSALAVSEASDELVCEADELVPVERGSSYLFHTVLRSSVASLPMGDDVQ